MKDKLVCTGARPGAGAKGNPGQMKWQKLNKTEVQRAGHIQETPPVHAAQNSQSRLTETSEDEDGEYNEGSSSTPSLFSPFRVQAYCRVTSHFLPLNRQNLIPKP